MKSSKSDVARNSHINGAATPTEGGPLFPRLHVSETEKAGPRAPPRNKMALFEQFTVPSHRFAQPQPSRPSTVLSNQLPQLDYRHPYFAYYTPTSMPYSNIVPSRPQPSHGVSSCVTTSSISDQESQRAFGSKTSEKCSISRATTKEDGSINLSSLLEEKAKVVSDEMQRPPSAHPKRQQAFCTSSAFENICDKFASASAESAEMLISTTTEVMSIIGGVVTCNVSESEGCGHERSKLNKDFEVTNARQMKRVTVKAGVDATNKGSHGCSSFASEQSCEQPNVDQDNVLSEDPSHLNDLAEGAANTELKTDFCRKDLNPSLCLAASAQTSTSQRLLGSLHARKDTPKFHPSDGEELDASASGDVPLKGKDENMGDSQNNQMGSNEVSSLSQQATGRDIDESPLSVLAAQAFRPKDVIRAVGQQQFWKARKALLRQQRIFSDQVFQLHKLIKVQQLLAETPGTLIDEEMLFGTVDHIAGSPTQCNTVRREYCRDETEQVTSFSKEQGSMDQSNKTGNRPESIPNHQWYAPVGNDGTGSLPYLPAFAPGGVSAWGYPSLGMGQWMSALPAQGRPTAYQPFAGAFSPGAPFGGLYGPPGFGTVSPMVPFCIPYAGQRSEPWEETSSNHGPHGAAPHNNPYYNQRFYAGSFEKNASAGSGASINAQRPAKPLHASGTEHTVGEASSAERLNNNGLDNSIHQSENSSPCNSSGFKFKSSANMQSTPAPRKAGSYHLQTERPAQMRTSSVFRTYSSSKHCEATGVGGQEEADKVEVRLSERQQNNRVPSGNRSAEETTGHPCDQSGNALDLFPLVPSLSSDGGKNRFKQTSTIWHGGVIKAVPHPAVAASQSAAGILLSLQRESLQRERRQ